MVLADTSMIQSGGYVNPWKCLAVLVVLGIWGRLLTWIDKDCQRAHFNRQLTNGAMFGGFLLGFFLFFVLPGFALAYPVLWAVFVAEVVVYLLLRKSAVGLADLKTDFNAYLKSFGSGKEKEVKVVAGQVAIINKNGATLPPPMAEDPTRPQYDAAQWLLTDPFRRGAERIDLAAGSESSQASYEVDGVRYEAQVMDRAAASNAIQYLKDAAGLDLNERRKPQVGTFKVSLDANRHEVQISTAGSAAGESMRLLVDPKSRFDFKIETLGFSEPQVELMKKLVGENDGVVLVSAPRGQGLTSLMYSILRSHDAFVYHIQTVERGIEQDLEGVTQNALPPNASGAEEAKMVSWTASQEPDILAVTSLEDPKSAQDLARAASGKRVYVGLRAGSTLEALRIWRKLVGDDALAMKNLKLVVSGRLVRKLCEACKVGYTPDPGMLRKLNMNPESVGKLFQARKQPMRDAKGNPVPCNFCHDLAFKGRMGVYETFVVDDDVRQVVKGGGQDNQLKMAFRKQKGRYLQEEALAKVQEGETSVEEVLRVLKADAPTARPPTARPAAAAG